MSHISGNVLLITVSNGYHHNWPQEMLVKSTRFTRCTKSNNICVINDDMW